ncbi:MAG TPA: bifunctional aconitate hydratase 2/2-methylisocitrate dehydratase, partial [Planctomycetaceae bacterium]|nr:bifunctional aconitate hydratase 2/2-methylisocitrate dehydratase [Planctomycetaceae bacterium]
MSKYSDYLDEIESRKKQGLSPKPIDSDVLLNEIIEQVKDSANPYREDSLNFLIYNTLPGTTSAARVKSEFLKEIILKKIFISEITPAFAFEQLSQMKGGPSVKVLIDLVLHDDQVIVEEAAEFLKKQVFLYEADTERLFEAYKEGNEVVTNILKSYAEAEFFTQLPEVPEEIEVVTYVAGIGDISTDLLSPGNEAHSRSDRELHGKCLINEKAQNEIESLQKKYPEKQVMLVAEKGTMGVG